MSSLQSKLLLSEIYLLKTRLGIQKDKNLDSQIYSKVLSSWLIESFKLQIILGHGSNNQTNSSTVLNVTVLVEILIEIITCLIETAQYTLASRCIQLVTRIASGTNDSAVKRAQSLEQQLKDREQKQRKEEEEKKVKDVVKRKSSIIMKKNFADDDDSDGFDDDGWPSDSEDEKQPSSGLLTLAGNPKLVEFDDDSDDSWGSGGSGFGGGGVAPLAGLIDNSDDEDDIQSVSEVMNEDVFPNRYHFFTTRVASSGEDSITNEQSSLITLRMEDGEQRFKSADSLLRWLETIVSKHTTASEYDNEEGSKQTNEVAIVESFQTNLTYMDAFSKKWAKEYYSVCWRLYHMGTRESRAQCWKLLSDYFTQLPNAKITKNIDQEDVKKLTTIFNISLQILHIAALLWTPELMNSFKSMMDSINQFNPRQTDAVTIVELKALCHHIRSVAVSSKRQECGRIVPTLLQLFEKHYRKASVSPTTPTFNSNPKAHIQKLASSLEIACEALLVFHQYLCNMSPLTLDPLLSNDDNINISICDDELQKHELFDLWNRFTYLESLYCKMNYFSMLKATTILSLGQMCRYFNEDMKSEMALFESLYIIDKTAPFSKLIPSIRCDYGTKALIEYATALVGNNKYPFSALTYMAAVKNHKTIHQEYDYALVSELAELSSKNDDWQRSCFYLRKLLKYNMQQGGEMNIPKVVYLSEKLSEECMERGDFRNAEYYITTSVTFVKYSGRNSGNSSSQLGSDYSKTGDTELNLQLKLANLFLQGYYFERGIDLLARIIEEKLTPMQRCLVLTNLAEAYLKKRWLKECEFVLNKLGPLLEPHILNSGDVVTELKILGIAAKCYYRRAKYHLALFCVNAALQKCSIPARLASLFFLKGRIFQSVCHTKNPVVFPLSLSVDKVALEKDENYSFLQQFYRDENDMHSSFYGLTTPRNNFTYAQRELYKDTTQLLQDCTYCFEKAIYYYTAVSDEINIAKVHLEIAKVQIEHVFSEAVFLEGDPVACSKLQLNSDSNSSRDYISIKDIEDKYIISAMDTSVRTTHIMLSLNSYITMAECRYLQGRMMASQSFWNECKDVLFTLFMNESEVVVAKGAPPGFLQKLLSILTRLVRLMFCYESFFINQNLAVVDALLMLEIELEQVLKRSGESSTEATFNSDSGNDSPSDGESGIDENALISQNRIYEALPINSSVSRGKSLPFLRRNRKKASLKLAGFRARKPAYGGSLKGSQSGSKMDGYLDAVVMTERITERVWSCFYRMKQHSRKYSGQTMSERDLCFKNQQSMRRLYNLMLAIRGKKITSLSPTGSSNSSNNDKRFSISDNKRNSTAAKNRSSTQSDHVSVSSMRLDEDAFVDQIDKKISHMSLTSGDSMLVSCFLKTWGEEESKKLQSSSITIDFEDNFGRHGSWQDISLTKTSTTATVNPKMLSRLVYILLLEHVVVYYVPGTGRKEFQQLGGRKQNGKAIVVSDRSGKSLSDSNLVSGSSMLRLSGTAVSETAKTFSGSSMKKTGTGTTGNLKEQATKYLYEQLDSFMNALLLQGDRDKRTNGLEQTEAIIDLLQTGLFMKAPFDYSSPTTDRSPLSTPTSASSSKQKFDYRVLLAKKSSRLSSVMSFSRTASKNISLLPKLEDIAVPDQPLLLLCSHVLQIIPWELMFSEFMTRTFSLQHISKQKQLRDRHLPAFFSFISEDESKFIAPIEKKRKEWLYYYVKKQLGLSLMEPGIFHDALPNLPLHSPLIKYGKKPSKSKKFKEINFVKLSMISENPTQIITHIESFLNTPQYPVFLFTLADLLDLSEAILCILSYRPDCTLVFIAEGLLSQAAEILLELQTIYGKNEQLKNPMNAYKFFAHCMTVLHRELRIPTVVINPPLPSNAAAE
jgi:hypothetical protein